MRPVVVSRRMFLAGGISLNSATGASNHAAVYAFATEFCEVRMSIVFYDRYSSSGFWFREALAGGRFCLSGTGAERRNCPTNFIGSLAVARYEFQSRTGLFTGGNLREHVLTIDQDNRLNTRPPCDRVIELRQGLASDIQAFGYETSPPASSPSARLPETGGPWYYFRQDLYFAELSRPFLIVHWRHAFGAIRILDVIPGDGTSAIRRGTQ